MLEDEMRKIRVENKKLEDARDELLGKLGK
jgi:hypothetical protein